MDVPWHSCLWLTQIKVYIVCFLHIFSLNERLILSSQWEIWQWKWPRPVTLVLKCVWFANYKREDESYYVRLKSSSLNGYKLRGSLRDVFQIIRSLCVQGICFCYLKNSIEVYIFM
jgi:hypothetical protein